MLSVGSRMMSSILAREGFSSYWKDGRHKPVYTTSAKCPLRKTSTKTLCCRGAKLWLSLTSLADECSRSRSMKEFSRRRRFSVKIHDQLLVPILDRDALERVMDVADFSAYQILLEQQCHAVEPCGTALYMAFLTPSWHTYIFSSLALGKIAASSFEPEDILSPTEEVSSPVGCQVAYTWGRV